MTINVQDIDPDEYDPTYEHAGFEIDDEDEYPYTWADAADDAFGDEDFDSFGLIYGFDDTEDCD